MPTKGRLSPSVSKKGILRTEVISGISIGPVTGNGLLLETGFDFLLLETGDFILLE